jgi:hypothetical protein
MSIILGLLVFFANKNGEPSDKKTDKKDRRKEKIISMLNN